MLKQFLEATLRVEMDVHLDEEERQIGNKRNGTGTKTIKSAERDLPDRHVFIYVSGSTDTCDVLNYVCGKIQKWHPSVGDFSR